MMAAAEASVAAAMVLMLVATCGGGGYGIRNSFGIRQLAAMCSTEWDGNSDVQLFPPGHCC